MTLKEYIDLINRQVAEDPAILDLKVVYSSDDEGNWFSEVLYAPNAGDYSVLGYPPERCFCVN